MAFRRKAEVCERGAFTSVVRRVRPSVPRVTSAASRVPIRGVLLTELMAPPVDPRPNSTEDGPVSTSTVSVSNGSR